MKRAAVVGGSRGTGLVIAARFAAEGWTVVTAARTAPGGVAASHVTMDLADGASIAAAMALLAAEPLDALVFAQRFRGDGDAWRGEMAVTLDATRTLIEGLTPSLAAGRGAVVIVGSIAERFVAAEQPAAYHAAKAALQQLARYYAVHLGPRGVRVNVVSPCLLEKPENAGRYRAATAVRALHARVVPLGRIPTSADVAGVVWFLCNDDAAIITGQTVTVDGGLSLLWQESLARELLQP